MLPRALRSALEGEAAISRRLSMRLVEQLRHMPAGGRGLRPVKSPLTPREWEVVDLIEQHMTTDQMADTLVLSTETVRTHVKNILRKLGVGHARGGGRAHARRCAGELAAASSRRLRGREREVEAVAARR